MVRVTTCRPVGHVIHRPDSRCAPNPRYRISESASNLPTQACQPVYSARQRACANHRIGKILLLFCNFMLPFKEYLKDIFVMKCT